MKGIVDYILYGIEAIANLFGQGTFVRDYRERRVNWENNKKYFNEISKLYETKLKEDLHGAESYKNIERSSAYELWVESQNFSNLSPSGKNVLVLLALCSEFAKSKNVDTYAAIHSYVNTFRLSFSNISNDASKCI
jgi:hypothetical protein